MVGAGPRQRVPHRGPQHRLRRRPLPTDHTLAANIHRAAANTVAATANDPSPRPTPPTTRNVSHTRPAAPESALPDTRVDNRAGDPAPDRGTTSNRVDGTTDKTITAQTASVNGQERPG